MERCICPIAVFCVATNFHSLTLVCLSRSAESVCVLDGQMSDATPSLCDVTGSVTRLHSSRTSTSSWTILEELAYSTLDLLVLKLAECIVLKCIIDNNR